MTTVALDADQPEKPPVFVSPLCHTVLAHILNQPVLFSVRNPRDVIQRKHMAGAFNEPDELAIIARHFPIGGRFLDIGANVGNHTLYVAGFLHACRIVCIEPNPAAHELLEANVRLNGLEGVVDLGHLGIGLSDRQDHNISVVAPARNLGAGRLVSGDGSIRVERGDRLLEGKEFDFIKIDVEGMELAVLEGLSGLLEKCRPKMFIEVDNRNASGFQKWLVSADYDVREEFRRYRANCNYLVAPKARP